ncbi:MAG: transglycosylase domain-containing protein [Actinomycetes bacterium]
MARQYEDVPFDSLLAAPGDRPGRSRSVARLAAYSMLAGLVVTTGLVPGAAVGIATANMGLRAWNSQANMIPAPALPGRTTLVDSKGKMVGQVFTINRVPVTGDQQSPLVRQAVVSIEDARFYQHHGIDPIGLLRAASVTGAGKGVQGGSTITQQYAKNLRLTQAAINAGGEADAAAVATTTGRSWERKIAEAHLALLIESRMSKADILTGYLNVAYFGASAYGIEAASHRFFSIPASKLNLAQSALLAGMLQSPSSLDPRIHPEAATKRRNTVLDAMAAQGNITTIEARAAQATPITLVMSVPNQGCQAARVNWGIVCDAAVRELATASWLGPEATDLLGIGGLTVHLTPDPATQAAAMKAAATIIPSDNRAANAITMVEPGTGAIKAMASNRRFGVGKGATEIPLATTPSFSPGSTFKVFTLMAALESGISLDTVLPGGASYTSSVFDNPPGGYHNTEGLSAENVTIPMATQMSINTAYVQLEEQVGVAAAADVARRMGIRNLPEPGHKGAPGKREGSFALGARDVSVTDMAGAYAAIANHGVWCQPTLVESVTLPNGSTIKNPSMSSCRQAVDPAVADTTAQVLGTVISSGTGKAAALPNRPAAGKTGTAENDGAAWFAGFTPQIAAAVWTGDPRSPKYTLHGVMGLDTVYGGTLPADLWRTSMISYLDKKPVVPLPGIDPNYLLSPGPPAAGQLTMVDLRGQSSSQAIAVLTAVGLAPTIKTVGRTGLIPAGIVIEQSPRPGTNLSPGAPVVLSVTE